MAIAVSGYRASRRLDMILAAIRKCLESQAQALNGSSTLRTVTVSVKMKNGSGQPRAVILNVETETECELDSS